ncbi:MAG: outer membrane protein assembly factor BamD [Proteobacteria bacterium]|nr:outer membrane protein assembly factor BamD [Pseudomonadota bacterium]MBU1390123.1 outer membrane protein assembly factor BamD [Pseudomonadota bacterium]MBU1544926.1 outer membrane protein assembly factor BamD [Pseudomonadota bacterium]MBU2429164.1 outer membrane protein assembly factor BamD [Pseudomonadota bacterium]MBU2482049.1 outer membrane protein assembly factor BamD [Pseudomonadota bacterium]
MKKLLFTLVLILPLLSCSLFKTTYQGEKTAEELISEGSAAFVAQEYRTAISAFTNLKDWYPFSKYAILAELKIGDAHFALKEYDEAILAYEEFERMHPKNEAIPYVIYRTGLCWFNQIDSVDRDSTPAQKAIVQFNRLIERFPESEHVADARKNIQISTENLSGHELYVANFYMKAEQYQAALKRYEGIVQNYPGSKESKEALNQIPKCRELIKQSTDSK